MSTYQQLLRFVACAAVGVAGLAVATPAAARPASTPESITVLSSGGLHVTTSTGKHLVLSLRATRFAKHAGGSNAHRPSTLQVSLRGNGGHETHQWSFTLAPNSFTDVAGGHGRLRTGGQIAPYGRLSLVITPVSTVTTQVCDNANLSRNHRVALKGTLSFLTHSPGPSSWGRLASRSVAFGHGTLHVGHGPDVEEACTTVPCRAGVSWTASHGNVDLNGTDTAVKGKKAVSRIEADRSIALASPAHATRLDTVIVRAPAPSLATVGGVKRLTATTAGGTASGSGRLTSNRHGAYRQDCSTGQMVGTQWNATYDAGVSPLTLHEQIYGPMSIAVDKNATFGKVHIS